MGLTKTPMWKVHEEAGAFFPRIITRNKKLWYS